MKNNILLAGLDLKSRVTMNQLILFYLMTSATQVIPLVIITLSLHYERPMKYIPKMPGDRSLSDHELAKIGIARFNLLSKLFDKDTRNYFARFSLIACLVQLVTTSLIIVAIIVGLPFPFVPHIHETLIMDVMRELLMFSATNAFLQLLPKIILDLIYFYGVPLPFIPQPPRFRRPLNNEIRRWAEDSEVFASIRLTRFENQDKIYYYAYCRNDCSGEVFKVVLCQGKEVGAKPQCFTYIDDEESTLKQINPVPISVNVLDEIFVSGVI